MKLKLLLYGLILTLLLSVVAQATTYYVRHTDSCGTCGDDEDGLAPSTAWITMQKMCDAVSADDTVWIGAGEYAEVCTLDGAWASYVHFLGDYTGANTGDPGTIRIARACANDQDYGHVHFSHIYFYSYGSCLYDNSSFVLYKSTGIQRAIIEHCRFEGALSFMYTQYLYFSNNFIKDNADGGFYGALHCQNVDSLYIDNNTMGQTTNHYAAEMEFVCYIRGTSYLWMRNNLFYSQTTDVNDAYIGYEDNTVTLEEIDYNYYNIDYPQYINAKKNGSWVGYEYLSPPNGGGDWQAACGCDASAQEGNPYLEEDNYHLTDSSDCIEAGKTIATVTDDIDGDSRPQGSNYDVGCDEYVTEAAVGQVIIIGDASNFHRSPRAHLNWSKK